MAHPHPHLPAEDVHVPSSVRRVLAIVAVGLGVLTAIAAIALRVTSDDPDVDDRLFADQVYDARVLDVEIGPCPSAGPEAEVECRIVTVRLEQGPDAGDERQLEFAPDDPITDVSEGDAIVVFAQPDAEPPFDYTFADRQRRPVLWGLAALFAVAVVALGRWRGLLALAGLGASLVVVLVLVLPAILGGHSPVLVAVVGASAIAYLALYLAHGVSPLTTVALLGTLASLALTVVLSVIFTSLAQFTGLASEEARELLQFSGSVNMEGLVLAGIVLGALGALDDMTVTQASAVAELHAVNPELGRGGLLVSGMRIGRDHIASTVNTLALAYVGAALPTMLLFVISSQSLGAVANSEVVAVEIVRTLVGSIGLVASVPITTWLATLVVTAGPTPAGRRAARRSPAGAGDEPGPAEDAEPAEDTDPGDAAALEARRPTRPGRRRGRTRPAPAADDDPDASFWH